MKEQQIMRYFLGGNTAEGFFSLYDSFVSPNKGDFLWIIKGGAGCGKSSFMKMIGAAAEKKGLSVEYAQCSGDPESLDGVYIPELKCGYMDGTAPHVTDARIAAVDSAYLDLGAFYNREAISSHKAELEELVTKYKSQYAKAYSLLAAAGSLRRGWLETLAGSNTKDTALSRIDGIATKEFGKRTKGSGSAKRRFISANTCKGEVRLPELGNCLCSRFYSFENRTLLGSLGIERLAEKAIGAGYDIVLCPDPLTPELYEAMFVPGLEVGFVCGGKKAVSGTAVRNIRLDSMVGSEHKRELRACEKLTDNLMSEAFAALAGAKHYHDMVEEVYNPNVDFESVYGLANKHISSLGLK